VCDKDAIRDVSRIRRTFYKHSNTDTDSSLIEVGDAVSACATICALHASGECTEFAVEGISCIPLLLKGADTVEISIRARATVYSIAECGS
jgi:hypothetical protein